MPNFGNTYANIPDYQYNFQTHLENKPVYQFPGVIFFFFSPPTWTKLQFARCGGGGVYFRTSLVGETAANYSWHFLWWHFSTSSLLNGTSTTTSTTTPPPHHHRHPAPTIHPPAPTPYPDAHINSPLYSCHNSTAEIVASCLHLIDPLSRCWIWSNHSQSSLNISFFKQNRGSKFHHSMTRSVADNTIKPIPAYPEGAISGGTAGRWDYRPTERCQSPLIHSSLCEPPVLRGI